jgi:hypothetical protein
MMHNLNVQLYGMREHCVYVWSADVYLPPRHSAQLTELQHKLFRTVDAKDVAETKVVLCM